MDSVLRLCTPVSPSVPEMVLGASFFEDVLVVEFM